MASEFKYKKMVEFAETDMAGIVHFSNYLRYMEMTEHAFFRSLGFSIETESDGLKFGWPRVQVECEYKYPLRFEDWIEVHLRVVGKSTRSLTYSFTLTKAGDNPVVAARGKFVVACIRTDGDAFMKSTPIPPQLAEVITLAESD